METIIILLSAVGFLWFVQYELSDYTDINSEEHKQWIEGCNKHRALTLKNLKELDAGLPLSKE